MPPADAPFTPAPRLQPSLQLAVAERGCVRAVFISVHGECMFPQRRAALGRMCVLKHSSARGGGLKGPGAGWLCVSDPYQRASLSGVPLQPTRAHEVGTGTRRCRASLRGRAIAARARPSCSAWRLRRGPAWTPRPIALPPPRAR